MDDVQDPVLLAAGVTRREAEVLGAIGRRLDNREIASRLTISVRTVESHVAQLRRKLQAEDRATLRRVAVAVEGRSRLPTLTTPLVGRDDEVAAVRARLATAPIVTILGPAGCGKTRLAVEVAALHPTWACLVDLASVGPSGVDAAIADGLGLVAEPGADPGRRASLALADRDVLLVVDGAEHVTDAVGHTVSALAASSPRLRVLVTSRHTLGVIAEVVVPLDPLPVPADGSLAAVAASSAATLLLERVEDATGVRPDLDPVLGDAVVRICRAVDGLPLGLELAAAASHGLGLDGVASTLTGRAGDPSADATGVLPEQAGRTARHRSLAAAVSWSWSLLGRGEQALLARMSALPDGLAVADLVAVSAMGRPPVVDVPRSLARLVDSSMVVARHEGKGTDYSLLATVRGVVRRRHADEAEVGLVRADFARSVLHRLAPGGARAWVRSPSGRRGRAAAAGRGDVAALSWSARADPEVGAGLLLALAQRHELDPRPGLLAGVRMVVEDIAIPDEWPVEALAWGGVLLNYVDLSLLRRCVAAAGSRATTDAEQAIVGWAATFAHGYDGDEQAAIEAAAAARVHFVASGDDFMVAHCDFAAGLASADPRDACRRLERAVVGFLTAGAPWHANAARLVLVRRSLEVRGGDAVLADRLSACRRFAEVHDLPHDRAHVGLVEALRLRERDPRRAVGLAEDVAATFRAVGDLRCLRRALEVAVDGTDDGVERVGLARRAVAVAAAQHDRPGQSSALDLLASAASGIDDALAARARGASARIDGRPVPVDDVHPDHALEVREGHAAGPGVVAERGVAKVAGLEAWPPD